MSRVPDFADALWVDVPQLPRNAARVPGNDGGVQSAGKVLRHSRPAVALLYKGSRGRT